MLKKIVALLFTVVFIASVVAQKAIAIKCGQLLNVRTGEVNTNQIILIKDNMIAIHTFYCRAISPVKITMCRYSNNPFHTAPYAQCTVATML